jgi:hypothetical protein
VLHPSAQSLREVLRFMRRRTAAPERRPQLRISDAVQPFRHPSDISDGDVILEVAVIIPA